MRETPGEVQQNSQDAEGIIYDDRLGGYGDMAGDAEEVEPVQLPIRFVAVADGLETLVRKQSDNSYLVLFQDTDAGQIIEVRVFPSTMNDPLDAAMRYAKGVLNGWEFNEVQGGSNAQ